MKEIEVLGTAPDLDAFRRALGERGSVIDERDPAYNSSLAAYTNGATSRWHQDDGGSTPWMVVWANDYPTEVRLSDGSTVSGQPGDIVLIHNAVVEHRIPEAYITDVIAGRERPRWFARLAVYSPADLDALRRQISVERAA